MKVLGGSKWELEGGDPGICKVTVTTPESQDLPYQELVDQFGDRAAEELWKHIHQQEPWMQYKSIPRLMRTAHLTANTWKSTAYSNVIQHLRRSFARAMHEMNGCIAEQKYRCPA